MWRKVRIGLLLFVLISVAHTAWVARGRATDWKTSVRVAMYPIAGDDSAATSGYVRALRVETLQPIAAFMKSEATRHGLALDVPVEVYLAHAVESSPPTPPFGGSTLDVMLWSLKFRYWAWRVDNYKRPKPDVRLFVRYFDPAQTTRVPHSTGLQKGLIGIVNAFAHANQEGANNVVITHELLHTLGASDKYDFASNQPLHPDGYAEPEAQPLLPQTKAEIMAGRIPLAGNQLEMPQNLAQCMVGGATAREINWVNIRK